MNSWAYKTMIYYWLVYNNNLENKMPFKIRLINDFKKCLQESRDNSEEQIEKQGSFENMNEGKQKSHNGKKITKKNYNIYQIDLKMNPTQSRHIANFYNVTIILLRLSALTKKPCVPTTVQTHTSGLSSTSRASKRSSRGPTTCCSILLMVVYLSLPYNILSKGSSPSETSASSILPSSLSKQHSVSMPSKKLKLILRRKKPMTFSRNILNRLAIECLFAGFPEIKCLSLSPSYSNLSTILRKSFFRHCVSAHPPMSTQWDMQVFRVRCRAASSEMYYDVIVKYLQNLINLLDLVCDKISLETFLDTSIMRFRDCLYTKHHKKLHCKIKTGMPNPLITIFEVQEIVNRSQEIQPNMFYRCRQDELIKRAQERIQKKQIGSVLSLMNLPKSFLPENQSRVPLYKDIEAHEMQRNMV